MDLEPFHLVLRHKRPFFAKKKKQKLLPKSKASMKDLAGNAVTCSPSRSQVSWTPWYAAQAVWCPFTVIFCCIVSPFLLCVCVRMLKMWCSVCVVAGIFGIDISLLYSFIYL